MSQSQTARRVLIHASWCAGVPSPGGIVERLCSCVPIEAVAHGVLGEWEWFSLPAVVIRVCERCGVDPRDCRCPPQAP